MKNETIHLYFYEEIKQESALKLIAELNEYNDMSGTKNITIHINTEGGSLRDSLAIYDTIHINKHNITTIAEGRCFSGGLTMLLAGKTRKALKNCIFLYHPACYDNVAFDSNERFTSLINLYNLGNIQYDRVFDSIPFIVENKDKETFFDSEQALKAGIVTEIIGE